MSYRRTTSISIAGVALVLFAAVPSMAAFVGKASVRYEAPETEAFKEIMTDLKARGVLEEVADSINEEINLPVNLALVAAECGEVNAFYDPNKRQITLCYELMEFFAGLHFTDAEESAEDGEVDGDKVLDSIFGATHFVVYHEAGHALVHLLNLPITGKEEDAVDQLATLVLINADDDASTNAVLDGAYTFMLQGAASEAEEEGAELAFWDEHSLDPQRFYNITCWMLGSDPETFASFVEDEMLPEARAVRCPGEWEQISNAWGTLLKPYFKKK